MITETIITTLITAVFAFAGVVISNNASNRKNSIEQAIREKNIELEIRDLSKKVDEHNGMLDRIATIEKAIVRIDTKLEGR